MEWIIEDRASGPQSLNVTSAFSLPPPVLRRQTYPSSGRLSLLPLATFSNLKCRVLPVVDFAALHLAQPTDLRLPETRAFTLPKLETMEPACRRSHHASYFVGDGDDDDPHVLYTQRYADGDFVERQPALSTSGITGTNGTVSSSIAVAIQVEVA
ncbi:hypothetical protein MVEN_02312100 [Mycena venus]|uniref:Uncharacterized protein n=1 Tax=Mycena venus TaxID=2733690 RepID=A0A8H6X412_9AGAR|nr:hypothetical protein MVEN_02312100 [Mycena venus]